MIKTRLDHEINAYIQAKGGGLSIFRALLFNICKQIKQLLPGQPCLLCGTASPDGLWCGACDAGMPYLSGGRCPICALPTLNGTVCGQCLQHPPHFVRTVAVYAYAFPLDKLILALKYGEKLHLAKQLGSTLSQCVQTRPDIIVPMPLHPARLRERGFNQSLQVARSLGRHLDLPVLHNVCQRIRNTPSQSSLPLKERSKNMRKAFSCTADLSGMHIAIVDDVMTTGATLNELARVLLAAGATEVSAWVVARTLPHRGHE